MKRWKWAVVIVALLFFLPNMALAETREDDSSLLLWTGVATGLSFVFLDEEIQEFSQRNILEIEDEGTVVQHSFTAMLPIFAAKGYLLGGDDIQAQLATRALLRGMAVNTIVTSTSKEVIGRKRPSAWEGAYQFEPFSKNRSFPSGHTSHSFTVATVLSEVYGEEHRWVPVVSYGAATFVAYSRIDGNKHWLSDVIVGAALGHLIGKWAVSVEERRMAITPVFTNDRVGLKAKLRF